LTICDRGAIGKGSRVLIIDRIQTIDGIGFSGGEWVSEGRHVVVCMRTLLTEKHVSSPILVLRQRAGKMLALRRAGCLFEVVHNYVDDPTG
jgi:hypothetical protein